MSASRYEVELAGKPLVLETGELAQQAGGAVTLRYGDTMLLGVVTASSPRRGIDFFPLSVEFEERLYAAGRIPGSFFRREGRPTTTAVLSARLTDRPLRPLFPKGYMDDTQIVLTILSADMENPPDTLGTIAASAALTISDVPFDGPVGSVRIGCVDDELILQPTFEQLKESKLNLVVAGTSDAIMMVEAEASEVPEQLLVDAMALGQEAIAKIVELQEQMQKDLGKEKRAYTAKEIDADAAAKAESDIGDDLAAALSPESGLTKAERDDKRNAIRKGLLAEAEDKDDAAEKLADAFDAIEKRIVRENILEKGARPDGRATTDLRPLSAQVGMIPRTHGSGLFQRGETQVLNLTTLAGSSMAQRLDDLTPEDSKRFMHHYNFPPWSVGETGRIGSTGRREIGHGMLGERALAAILPDFEDFPYTIRLVSEVLSSNGSTSMASVCAAVLSMMDAGVPLKQPIAGIAMGLIKGEDNYAVLTDIAGLEDHLGDMDFKVAGSKDGVTALQMDIKVRGIELEVMGEALQQARDARLEIMDVMLDCIREPREELAEHAPRMYKIVIDQEKIGLIIGPGGKTIRQIEEDSGASVNIENDGTIFVMATDQNGAKIATDQIRALTKEVEPGEIYDGKVVRILSFGAFVEILPGKDALVHISELAHYRVGAVEDIVKVGDAVKVKVTEIDGMGRINASRKALLAEGEGEAPAGGGTGDSDGGGRDGGRGRRDDRGGRDDRPRDEGRRRGRRDDRRPRRDESSDEASSEVRADDRGTNDGDAGAPETAAPEPETAAPRAAAAKTADEAPRGAGDGGGEPRDSDSVEPSDSGDAGDRDSAAAERTAPSEDRSAASRGRPAERRRDGEGDAGGDSASSEGTAPRRRRRRRRRTGGGSGEGSGGGGNGGNSGGSGGSGSGSGGGGGQPRGEREERPEKQPSSNDGRSRRGGVLARVGLRRTPERAADGPPAPPPPPRSDFGAPS